MDKVNATIVALLFCLYCFAQPSNLEKYYDEGFALYKKGEIQKALAIFEKIYAMDSTETNALDFATILYGQTGQYARAAKGCSKLSILFPQNDNYFSSACFFYTLDNQPEIAEKYGKKAVALNEYRFNNMLNLAHTYLLQYKKDEAIYWYIRAMQWLPNKRSFDRAFLGDFDLIDSLKLMPANIVQQFKKGLTAECEDIDFKSTPSVQLDSILSYIDKKPTPLETQKIIQWKKDFIEEEAKISLARYDVAATFAVDIGLQEYRNRNRATAMFQYFDKAVEIYKYAGDSLRHAALLIFVSKELLTFQQVENKYGNNSMILDYAIAGRDVVKKYQLDELQASSLHQLSEAYFQKDDQENAYKTLIQLLKWSEKKGDGKGYFWATNSLSVYYAEKNKYDSAIYYNRLCQLRVDEADITRENKLKISLNGLDLLYSSGKYDIVLLRAMMLKEDLTENDGMIYSSICELEGASWVGLKKNDSAYVYFKEAVDSYIEYSNWIEKNKKDNLPLQVNEGRMNTLWALCGIAAGRNDQKELFKWIEMMKENHLRYLISLEYQPKNVTTLEKAKAALPKDAVAITFIGLNLDKTPTLCFDNKNGKIHHVESNTILKEIQQSGLNLTFSQLLKRTNKNIHTRRDSAATSKLLALMQFTYLSNLNLDDARGIAVKKTESKDDKELAEEKIKLAKLLYRVYVQPFENMLAGKKTIYISGDYMVHFIPFESLMMPDGRYLAEAYDIVYTPGFTIKEYLENRTYNNGERIVAIGNPDYSTYHPEKLQGRALDYSMVGIKSWTDLPGTLQEIEMLQQQFDSVSIITSNQLSETKVKKLSESGQLSNAAILHFSLHGMAGTKSAFEDNSLVITEPDNGKEDGLLQFYEAYELDIKPSLVCLSACETGLGMLAVDGSLTTMVTAFLAAGAKAVLATNWSIDDAATALFIKEVYKQVHEQKITFAASVANTKRRFIKGEFGEKYKQPLYWAPFKYYGN